MSLSFQFTGMTKEAKDNPNYCWTEIDGRQEVAPVSHTIIFACLGVGIGAITEKNVDEFYGRMVVYAKIGGPGKLFEDGKERLITEEELHDHIGLTTNVGNETRTQWMKRVISGNVDDWSREYRRWNAKQKETV